LNSPIREIGDIPPRPDHSGPYFEAIDAMDDEIRRKARRDWFVVGHDGDDIEEVKKNLLLCSRLANYGFEAYTMVDGEWVMVVTAPFTKMIS
jgi:hypothetical protein